MRVLNLDIEDYSIRFAAYSQKMGEFSLHNKGTVEPVRGVDSSLFFKDIGGSRLDTPIEDGFFERDIWASNSNGGFSSDMTLSRYISRTTVAAEKKGTHNLLCTGVYDGSGRALSESAILYGCPQDFEKVSLAAAGVVPLQGYLTYNLALYVPKTMVYSINMQYFSCATGKPILSRERLSAYRYFADTECYVISIQDYLKRGLFALPYKRNMR